MLVVPQPLTEMTLPCTYTTGYLYVYSNVDINILQMFILVIKAYF